MVDHPLYVMWKQRYAVEALARAERDKLQTLRQEEQRQWREAWDAYERHWREGRRPKPVRHWWREVSAGCVAFVAWLFTPPAALIAGLLRRSPFKRA